MGAVVVVVVEVEWSAVDYTVQYSNSLAQQAVKAD